MIEATPTTQTRTQAPPRVEQRRSDWRTGLLGLHSVLSFIFLYAPIVVLVVFSFTNDSFGVVWKGFTLKWYAQLFQNERLIGATINTLKVALVSTVISTVIGTLMALALERYRFRGRTGLDALLYLPIVIPEIVMALALLAFFAFSLGLLENITGQQWRLSIVTVIISHIAFSISFVNEKTTSTTIGAYRKIKLRIECRPSSPVRQSLRRCSTRGGVCVRACVVGVASIIDHPPSSHGSKRSPAQSAPA